MAACVAVVARSVQSATCAACEAPPAVSITSSGIGWDAQSAFMGAIVVWKLFLFGVNCFDQR